jgi:Uma2 family endonuclease
VPPARFGNAADWLRALGEVPLDRIVFDPWPGTATEDDLLRYVERDKRLCELIEGTLVVKPVGYLESYVAGILLMRLNEFVLRRGLGAVTGEAGLMRLVGGRVRMPDVAFVSSGRLPGGQVPTEPVPSLAPDLAAEVLSESNTPAEMDQKLREYFASGTRLAWIVDPRARSVTVYDAPGAPVRVLGELDVLDGGDVVPGFVLPVADLFLNLPRPQ